jgi:hypothetical protein
VKLTHIEGPAQHLQCAGCQCEGIGGSIPYRSAASGEERAPDEWYCTDDKFAAYCAACAAKLVYEDPTRSVTTFYTNTEGTEVEPYLT